MCQCVANMCQCVASSCQCVASTCGLLSASVCGGCCCRYWCGQMACHHGEWRQDTVEQAVLDVCPEMEQSHLCVVDVRCLHDMRKTFDRRHLGIHPSNITGILQHKLLYSVLEPMAKSVAHLMRSGATDTLSIVCVCRSGHHRSMAVARLMYQVIKNDPRLRLGRLLDMTDGHWSTGCGNCAECSWGRHNEIREEALNHGLKVWCCLFEKALQGKL